MEGEGGEGDREKEGHGGSAAALVEESVVALGCAGASSRDGAGGAREGVEGHASGGALEVYTLKTHPGASVTASGIAPVTASVNASVIVQSRAHGDALAVVAKCRYIRTLCMLVPVVHRTLRLSAQGGPQWRLRLG